MIERVEIIHGASAIQGMGASGGIINIITKSATEGASHELVAGFSAPTEATSDGLSYRMGYLFRHMSGDWRVVTGVQLRSTGMYVDGNGDLIGTESRFNSTAYFHQRAQCAPHVSRRVASKRAQCVEV